jgi:PKD repeat protein
MSQIFQIRPQKFALPIPAPTADFMAIPVSGDIPLLVNFTFTGTGIITEYRWDFESAGTAQSTLKDPSFTFNTPGTYDVTVFVSGPGGSATETKVAFINAVQITEWALWQGGSAVTVDITNASAASTTIVSDILDSTDEFIDTDFSTTEDFVLTYGTATSTEVNTILVSSDFWFDKTFDTTEDFVLTYGTATSALVNMNFSATEFWANVNALSASSDLTFTYGTTLSALVNMNFSATEFWANVNALSASSDLTFTYGTAVSADVSADAI